ncbi:hypothetical protein CORC01_11939 [Colletotrichum orchidophilum]|uniref:Uncharacterized protein n=1 Tax=Colletotrichum orchidophilum TaxID=1209926 RepID=A0A1G4AUD7_9PEZI|nr:uncharacterized protein CORC01_11939 [Colletotrichum orchidophilum]OHE92789.1 hypothetical protein CORC01_11939 [Colletotrichum orchidophilum]
MLLTRAHTASLLANLELIEQALEVIGLTGDAGRPLELIAFRVGLSRLLYDEAASGYKGSIIVCRVDGNFDGLRDIGESLWDWKDGNRGRETSTDGQEPTLGQSEKHHGPDAPQVPDRNPSAGDASPIVHQPVSPVMAARLSSASKPLTVPTSSSPLGKYSYAAPTKTIFKYTNRF